MAGTIQGDAPSMRVAFVADDTAEFVDEGATIPESEPGLNEALIYTRKFALLTRLSREQYSQGGTPNELARSVARAMTFKADNAFLAQAAPTSPAVAPVPGLLNYPGIQSQTGVATNLDKLIDLEATVRSHLGYPTSWILAPDTWATLRKMKTLSPGTDTVTSNVGILGAGTDNAEQLLLGIPVDVRPQMPSKTGLLIDSTQIVSAVSLLEVATDISTYFMSDSVGIRAVWRTGHTIPRPERIGKFSLT
jgi:HK97 family phage major capsid protein